MVKKKLIVISIIIRKISTVFILTSLILQFDCIGQTNVYHPFPDSNAYWHVRFGGYQCNCCASYRYSFDGDTMINGTTYHKIHRRGVQYYDDLMFGCTTFIDGTIDEYTCAIRNDNIQKKIFLVPRDSAAEYLLYDFNLREGDTLLGWIKIAPYSFSSPDDTITVSLVDSILINSQFRKRWTFSNLYGGNAYNQIIEGIGNSGGPFYEPLFTFEAGGEILCFQQSGQVIYPDSNSVCTITGIDDDYYENNILIFPNPTSDYLNLSFNHSNKTEATIEFLNMYGQCIKKDISSENEIQFSLKDIENGVYFMRIMVTNNEYVSMIIKQ